MWHKFKPLKKKKKNKKGVPQLRAYPTPHVYLGRANSPKLRGKEAEDLWDWI